MAPVKISFVVSFSSQDPKFPVENLLRADAPRPWLCCPQDRSRQLRVELQLERAIPIGYVDVGNCGCAFLQLEVGRSSWPRDRPYLTLVPSVALMSPAESRLEQNRCGVRMFKEADFPEPALGQRWDRLRLTLSQPFNRHSQFGLSFIRVRTPLDPQHPPGTPQHPVAPAPALLMPRSRREEEEEEELRLKRRLAQLEPSCLSRPARMLLSAARSRASRSRTGTRGDPELLDQDPGGSAASGELGLHWVAALGAMECPSQGHLAWLSSRRFPPLQSVSVCPWWREHGHGAAPALEAHPRPRLGVTAPTPSPPVPTARFSLELLPTHASGCGEDADGARPPSAVTEAPWVSCPICALPCSTAEVQHHASTCGEPAAPWGS
ncbi:XRCC1 protein, partial [Eolophus roseicapillus]|nr:XRCC1 protein [Eolophus roseicapilla]